VGLWEKKRRKKILKFFFEWVGLWDSFFFIQLFLFPLSLPKKNSPKNRPLPQKTPLYKIGWPVLLFLIKKNK